MTANEGWNRIPMRALLVYLVLAAPIGAQQASYPPPGECPQPRFTGKAPTEYLTQANPVTLDANALVAAESLYLGKSKSVACAHCHGVRGDGKGPLASQFNPPPRNFACKETVNGIPDGQLFWIIRNGSPDTAMPPSRNLTDEQVWQLVAYLRRLAR